MPVIPGLFVVVFAPSIVPFFFSPLLRFPTVRDTTTTAYKTLIQNLAKKSFDPTASWCM
jgi:hypothetical protein